MNDYLGSLLLQTFNAAFLKFCTTIVVTLLLFAFLHATHGGMSCWPISTLSTSPNFTLSQTHSLSSFTPLEEPYLSGTSPFTTLEELSYISSIRPPDPYGQELSSHLKDHPPFTPSLMNFQAQP